MLLHHHEKTTDADGEWSVLGRVRYHAKAICDVLFVSPSTHVSSHLKVMPRLISLAQDRVSLRLMSLLNLIVNLRIFSFVHYSKLSSTMS